VSGKPLEPVQDLDGVEFIGAGLRRPECVLCTADRVAHVSNWDGGISRIHADGRVEHLLARAGRFQVKPNGICLLPDRSYLLAHLGEREGGIYQLHPGGDLSPFLTEVNGEPLPPSNYVHLDRTGRIWITVSTRLMPRALGYRPSVADGFIVLLHDGKARIVADDLGYANECVVDPAGEYLYVNETFGRRLSRFAIGRDHVLGKRETVASFGAGTFPDGLVFDADGAIWITSIISNRLIRIGPDGGQQTWLEDVDPEQLEIIEAAFVAEQLGRPHLDKVHSRKLRNISSMAFGGADLQDAYLGCLLDERIARIRLTLPGHPPAHWNF
jgi:hypothetical protein